MLSDALHRFSPYHTLPSTTLLSNGHLPSSHIHATGPDTLAQGSHHALQQLQQHVGVHNPHLARPGPQVKHRQHPYGPVARTTGAAGPIRRRISRACDQCNQIRTKCDGQHPCAHCIEFGLRCEYIRERKKRGRASRKYLTAQAAAQAAAAASPNGQKSEGQSAENAQSGDQQTKATSGLNGDQQNNASEKVMNDLQEDAMQRSQRTGSMDSVGDMGTHQPHLTNHANGDHLDSPTGLDLSGYGSVHSPYPRPGWTSMSSPPPQYQPSQLRYPVLEPLVHHLANIIPVSLACDFVDMYFASSSSAQMHPMSPYVLGLVFRKRSFLHPSKPRQCQSALLASILWIAAQTSDTPFLTRVPSARGKICQKLLELTVNLLKPLIHTPSGDTSPVSSPVTDGIALSGLRVALPGSISMDALTGESGAFGAAGTLDDVVTYIHLATVVSASEYKGASLRWWNAAWSLARELKLGRELPQNAPSMNPHPGNGNDLDADGETEDDTGNVPGVVTEEEREERRRIWWLVYIVDRHLALYYNRPLFLLDIECEGLLQPMDDTAWQNGEFRAYATDPNVLASDPSGATQPMKGRGPSFECAGHSIYGYFLPLMTILGEIVDLHHARNHPRFGVGFRSFREWDDQTSEITRHLETYEQSLKKFEQRHLNAATQTANGDKHTDPNTDPLTGGARDIGTPSVHSVHSVHTSSSRMTESDIQTRIVTAYGTHVMHVLHILLTGKWDPINLLDDNDLWISSQGFITATSHAVNAAEAISSILDYDPGLEFMPFFFGIYLLQGSFLLLLIADKLQFEASASVLRACETIIRAHEACVVSLNTEYRRNFSKVMRSALAQVRGRMPDDLGEQHQRRRELLAIYRWTGDGTGLAL